MLFTDSAFLLRFLPPLLALFFIAVALTPRSWRAGARRFSLANAVLLAGSIVFLLGGVGAFIWLITASVLFNYVVALAIGWARGVGASSARPTPLPEALLTLALTGNVGLLGVYKFAVPLGADLDRFAERSFAVPHLLAPLGLTVITCHAISYVVDVYRGQTPHQVSPIRTSLYLVFFPLLCAGPLVRYSEMGPQLADRRVTMAAFAYGVRRWLVGLCKVVLLANTLAVPATAVFAMRAGELGTIQAWVGAVCFALQVYFDLSGYSDMAIGFSRMFGFRLSENFRWPYGATTLTEFWRRWNISLIAWCRGYLGLSLEDAAERRVVRARRLVVLFLSGRAVARSRLEPDALGSAARRGGGSRAGRSRRSHPAAPRGAGSCVSVARGALSVGRLPRRVAGGRRRHAAGHGRVHRGDSAVVTRADAAPVDRADDRRAGGGAALAGVQPMDRDG